MESTHKSVRECRTDLVDTKGSPEQIKEQAKLWGVQMNSDDEIFYQNQCLHPRIGHSTNFTTRRDILAKKHKKEHERHVKLSEKSKNNIRLLEKTDSSDMISDEETQMRMRAIFIKKIMLRMLVNLLLTKGFLSQDMIICNYITDT